MAANMTPTQTHGGMADFCASRSVQVGFIEFVIAPLAEQVVSPSAPEFLRCRPCLAKRCQEIERNHVIFGDFGWIWNVLDGFGVDICHGE